MYCLIVVAIRIQVLDRGDLVATGLYMFNPESTVKFTLKEAMKAQRCSKDITVLFL